MSLILPDRDTLYAAMLARDGSYDGHVFVCVATTGIFCHLTCPARKPKLENSIFHDSAGACLAAGFRPCLRCKPMDPVRGREPLVADLMDRLEREPGRVWSEDDLLRLKLDPSTVRRVFKRHVGMTFLDLARLRRTGRAMARLSAGTSVVEAQLEAGFESASGFRDAVARLVRDNPAHLKGRQLLTADWIETPLGPMLAVAGAQALHLLEFFDRKALPAELARLRADTRSAIGFGRSPAIDAVAAEIDAYFAGRSATFLTPLAQGGAPFARTVWDALRAIPPGQTCSYGELARGIGRPGAVRAAAQANGANRLAIVIPCHRVIGADGDLTGYGGGLWRKRWLIEHERRAFGSAPAPARASA